MEYILAVKFILSGRRHVSEVPAFS